MDSFLPRGVLTPQDKNRDLPTPSEDLNITIKKLLDSNSQLQEKIEELEGDKKHFQMKLEEYIRFDREEAYEKSQESHLEREIDQLTVQNARLKAELGRRGEREMEAASLGMPHSSDRDKRALLLHRISELQSASRACQDHHGQQMERMKADNSRLQEEVERLKYQFHSNTVTTSSSSTSDWRSGNDDNNPLSWKVTPYQYSAGYSSLPESLPSYPSSNTGVSSEIPNLANLTISSSKSSYSTGDVNNGAELKKLKKQLEKYKISNVELDQKLKDAKLEVQGYRIGGRGTDSDVMYRMDVERLRSENARLQSQLDRLRSDNNYLRSMIARR